MSVKVKICGVCSVADARMVTAARPDFMGIVVEVAGRARSRTLPQAQEVAAAAGVPVVALTVNLPLGRLCAIADALHPSALQLHGGEPPWLVRDLKAQVGCAVWKVLPLSADARNGEGAHLSLVEDYAEAGADALTLDAQVRTSAGAVSGGLGVTVDWERARRIVRESPVPVFLAGGLNPDNVEDAIRAVQPFGVDVSTGVERRVGEKDPERVRAFIERARRTK